MTQKIPWYPLRYYVGPDRCALLSSKGNFFLFLILFSLEHKAHLYKRQGGGKPATWVAGGRRSERAPGGRRSERALSARARPASAVRCPALPPAAHPLPCLQPFFFDPCCAAVNVKALAAQDRRRRGAGARAHHWAGRPSSPRRCAAPCARLLQPRSCRVGHARPVAGKARRRSLPAPPRARRTGARQRERRVSHHGGGQAADDVWRRDAARAWQGTYACPGAPILGVHACCHPCSRAGVGPRAPPRAVRLRPGDEWLAAAAGPERARLA